MKFARIATDAGLRDVRIEGAMAHVLDAPSYLGGRDTGATLPADPSRLLAPVVPGKIVCVGRNYRAHAKELGNEVPAEPLIFMKPPSSVVGPGEAIVLPAQSARVEHEAELAVVLGRRLRRAAPGDVAAAIFGYTVANDVTARDIQRKEAQFTRAKGFDTFCPLGPWIVTERPGASAAVIARVGGAQRQHGVVGDMVFGIDELLSFISHVMTLEPGDVVLTGTPEGVGPLLAGDTVEAEVEGVGTLSNPVRAL